MPETPTIPAPTATAPKKQEKKSKKSPQQFVTTESFNQFSDKITDVLGKLVETVQEIKNKPAVVTPEIKEAEEVRKAKHDQAPINPSWEEKAIEIIGEAVDHCEVFYPKAGGQIFTVVIKSEFSNAPKEYIERMKTDRRSREIGNEGISGVENWCKLIRQNLRRK